MNLDDSGFGQCGGSYQTKMDMPVDDARHDRPRKPRYSRPLNGGKAGFDRPQQTGHFLDDRWSVAMTDPEIVNGKPRAHLPISVRTAYSSGKKVKSNAFCKKLTPDEPPVPVLKPIVRCTVRR